MKRAIVIGASGFLGRHVVAYLLEQGYEVFAVQHKQDVKAAVTGVLPGGIKGLNRNAINRLQPDCIFHCARPVMPRLKKWGRMLAAIRAARYNKWLLKELSAAQIKPKLIFASGSLMYGNSPDPHDENAPLAPISYARQYFAGELPILKAIRDHHYPVIMMRFPWLLGIGSWFKWFYLDPALTRQCIPVFHPADNMMEIVTVADAARIMVIYATKADQGIYNIPSAGAITQNDFLEMVSEKFNARTMDHREIPGYRVEKEALEAFRSNILLATKYPELLSDYKYMLVADALERIRNKVVK